MTISQMLMQSGLLTLLGMAVVFSFIIVMVICMNLLRIVVHALKLDKDEVKSTAKTSAPAVARAPVANVSTVDQNAVIAAIAVAVREKESV